MQAAICRKLCSDLKQGNKETSLNKKRGCCDLCNSPVFALKNFIGCNYEGK